MDINKQIGLRIKRLREGKNELQKETANNISQIGTPLSDSQLGLYELGLRKVPNNILIALADYFNVSTDYLLCRTEEKYYINEPIPLAASMKDGVDLSQMSEKDKKVIWELYKTYKKMNGDG